MNIPIEWSAVFVAAIATFALGSLWYGPLFGKTWMRLMGISEQQMMEAKQKGMVKSGMLRSYSLMFVGNIITSYVLGAVVFSSFLFFLNLGVWAGALIGFALWLGFVAPVTLGTVLWEGKSWKLWVLNNSYYLVSFVLMGFIFMWMA